LISNLRGFAMPLFLAGLTASPSIGIAAPAVCANVAALIEEGGADGAGVGAPFGQFLAMASRSQGYIEMDNSGGSEPISTLEKLHAPKALLDSVRSQRVGTDSEGSSLFWLGNSKIGMVVSTGDLPICEQHILFFDATGQAARLISPPPHFSMKGAGCFFGASVFAGAVGNTPVIVKQDDSGAPAGEQLTFFPLANGLWDRPCRIALNYGVHFKTIGKFCRNGIDCSEMKKLSHVLYDRFNHDISADDASPDATATDLPTRLAELARRTSELRKLPTFVEAPDNVETSSSGPDRDDSANQPQVIQVVPLVSKTFAHQRLYPVDIGSGIGVGAIGPAASARGTLDGLLISIWEASGNTLAPLAGFETRSVRGKVKSISIDMPYATGDR
jgi:hypothetical protein